MLEDPGLNAPETAVALRTAWAVEASAFTFMPGYDMRAASYEVRVATTDARALDARALDARAFLKVRFGPASDAPPSRCRVPCLTQASQCPGTDADPG